MSAAAKKYISKTGQCHVGLCESKWKIMAHTYGQHYHIFMVLYLVVHMSELQRITKKIPQTFFLSHIICWKLGNSCETEKKHADALHLSRYVQQNCQDTF